MQKNRSCLSLTATLLATISLAACSPAETEVPAPSQRRRDHPDSCSVDGGIPGPG
jgi:nitrous oxide reductase accessory protein NosL